jgi:hypothetical protein
MLVEGTGGELGDAGPLPPLAATANPAAVAPPTIARIAINFLEGPLDASAAGRTLAWLIVAVAAKPWNEAFTKI